MFTLASFIVLLLMLIFVHELGHFLAAKLLGVRVEKFSLGFPPKMFSKTIGETEYQLAWLPLGGYVKLFGEESDLGGQMSEADKKRSFTHKPVWVRAIIVFAGPLFNLVFAALILWALLWYGGENHLKPVVGRVEAGSPAAGAGLRPFDEIRSVNGRPVIYFDQIPKIIEADQGAELTIGLTRQGRDLSFIVKPERRESEDVFGSIETRYLIGISPYMPAVIGKMPRDSRAREAGLNTSDRILSINGAAIDDWQGVITAIQSSQPEMVDAELPEVKPIVFRVINQEGQELTKTVWPKIETLPDRHGEIIYMPTVGFYHQDDLINEPYGFFQAAWGSLRDTGAMISLTGKSLYNLLNGKISIKTMGGPIFIADVAGKRAAEGLASFFYLAAFISVNLGLLNLLPLPVLDGGQLVFFGVEAIRRRPMSQWAREKFQLVGMGMLALLMVVVMFNDISRLVTRWTTNWSSGSPPAQSTVQEGRPPELPPSLADPEQPESTVQP